jgi:mannose-1-phosphate guanylyltransferase
MSTNSGRRFKTAFVLGAGLGTRLRPLTEACPKPLLPLGGRPIITYAMDHLAGVGVERFIVNTHHHPDAYAKAFPDGQWRGRPVVFRYEPILLDTGGGLKNIEDLLEEDDAIICYNGDIVADFPLKALIDAHEQHRPHATLALRSSGPLLNVTIDKEGHIRDMRDTLGDPGVRRCLFTGVYTVENSILPFMEPGRVESVVPVLLRRITEQAGSVRGIVIDEGEWNDIGSVDVYREMVHRASAPHPGRRANA